MLPVDFLASAGLSQIHYNGAPAVKIPYLDSTRKEVTARIMTRDSRSEDGFGFTWKKNSKPVPYGLWRLHEAVKMKLIVVVGTETESHVLWHHGMPSLAVTDAAAKGLVECLEQLPKIQKIYVMCDGTGADQVLRLLGKSTLRPKVLMVKPRGERRSLAAIHLDSPDSFWEEAKAQNTKCTLDTHEAEIRRARVAELWESCEGLAVQIDILDVFAGDFVQTGIIGEGRLAKLLYLAVTSRLLDHPVSVAVKGPSSCGKSATTQAVLKFFPDSACYKLSSMSEKALVYSPEPFEHRMLFIAELAGVRGDFLTYTIRTLLSENRIRYDTVINIGGEHTTRTIEKEGPTGLILTTTLPRWHDENETRMVSVTVDDSPEQTRRVLAAMAVQERQEVDMLPWRSFQEWLELGEHRVTIPFAETITELMPRDLPPRLRRDFANLLSLVEAHAILHQESRDRDDDGRIVALVADYATVRELVADLLAEGIQNAVPQTVRETVASIAALVAAHPAGVSEPVVAKAMQLDKSVVSRRLKVAKEGGYVKNLEPKLGRSARWVLDHPMPEDQQVLPTVDELVAALQCCIDKAS